jgi:uncharacterized membrane protein YhaH (DUF805 family)
MPWLWLRGHKVNNRDLTLRPGGAFGRYGDMLRLFRFDGRIGRLEFALTWIGVAMGVYIAAFTFIVATGAGDERAARLTHDSMLGASAGAAVFIAQALWVLVAAAVKRCHDRGRSGLWVLNAPVPVIGQLWLLLDLALGEGAPDPNRYGRRDAASRLSIQNATA